LYRAAVSTKGRIVIRGVITTIARFLDVEPNPEHRVLESEWLDQAAFELMNFCKVEVEHLWWICPEDRLFSLPGVDRTTLLHWGNLQWIPADAEVVQPTSPPPPFIYQTGPSSSFQPTASNYADLQVTLRSI